MYGPLIFESGVPEYVTLADSPPPLTDTFRTKRGVLISSRPCPQLFSKTTTPDHLVDNFDGDDSQATTHNSLVLYKDKTSHATRLLQRSQTISSRQTLCSVKRVYGGAFSGFPAMTSTLEKNLQDSFISEASKCKFNASKTVKSRRRQLHRSSESVTKLIQEIIGDEVRKFVNRTASVLLNPETNLTWHVMKNNCQKLIDRLLSGKDFEYIFPRLPERLDSSDSVNPWALVPWPRYLISFGDRVEGKDISLYQPNSSVAEFCHKGAFDTDVIDFLEIEIELADRGDGNPSFVNLSELALVTPQLNFEESQEVFQNTLWDLPRDTFSILQFHLMRPYSRYSTVSGQAFDDVQWLRSRLRTLTQLDIAASYTGALGSALLSAFYTQPSLTSKVTIPKSRIFGSLRADEKVRIIRSGGIVGYVIAQRQQRLTNALDLSAKVIKMLQVRFEKRVGKLGASVLKSRAFKAYLDQLLLPLTMIKNVHDVGIQPTGTNFLEEFIRLRQFVSPFDHLGNAAILGMSLIDRMLKLELQVFKVAHRDNWIYLNLGELYLAYQILGSNKNTRKKPRMKALKKG